MQSEPLVNNLITIGFEEKEARIYLALLELGEATATQISERSQITRALVYHIIEKLKIKGYAQELPNSKIKKFIALDADRIIQNVSTSLEDLRVMLPYLRTISGKSGSEPKIEYFEDQSALSAVYRMYNRAKNVRYATSIQQLNEYIPSEVHQWKNRYKKGMKGKEVTFLLENTPEDIDWGHAMASFGHNVYVLPKDLTFNMDLSIVDNSVGITSFNPFFVVIVHSQSIAKAMASFYDIVLSSSEKMTATN